LEEGLAMQYFVPILILCGLGVACTAENVVEPVRPAHSEVPTQHFLPRASAPTFDNKLLAVAQRVPGFAGIYYDGSGTQVVRLTPGTNANAVVTELRRAFPNGRARGGASRRIDPQLIPAAYNFQTLYEWRLRADALLAGPGVVATDIDEVRNAVWIAVVDAETATLVMKSLSALGIPDDALEVVITDRGSELQTLRDQVSPTPGGVQIQNSIGATCTLALNAYYNLELHFVTAGHCAKPWNTISPHSFYQPIFNTTPYFLGLEAVDPLTFTGFGCPSGRLCRYADGVLVKYYGVPPSAVDCGTIARPDGTGGTIEIAAGLPRLIIQYDAEEPFVGEEIDKVGRTTGWSFGQVSQTCVNLNRAEDNVTIMCNTYVAAAVGMGDSGSPAFLWLGGIDVAVAGIVHYKHNGYLVYSPLDLFEFELDHGLVIN
jgi:hypothetical protein